MSSLNLLPVKLGWSNKNTRDSIPTSQTGFKISVQSLSGQGARHLSGKCCDSEGQMICDTWHHGCKHCCTAVMFRPSDNSTCKKRKGVNHLLGWRPLVKTTFAEHSSSLCSTSSNHENHPETVCGSHPHLNGLRQNIRLSCNLTTNIREAQTLCVSHRLRGTARVVIV